MGAQTYPSGSTTFIVNGQSVTDNNPPNYAALLSSGKTASGTVQTPMTFLFSNLNKATSGSGVQGYTSALGISLQNIESTTMIYQYYGLNNIRTWAQSVSTYNSTNTESSAESSFCPWLFSDTNWLSRWIELSNDQSVIDAILCCTRILSSSKW